MPQYLVIAKDGRDPDALSRRMAARPNHLSLASSMFADGSMREGGAILNPEGRMIGSACVVDFPNEDALNHWLQSDPYVLGDVWKEIEVLPFKSAKEICAEIHAARPQ